MDEAHISIEHFSILVENAVHERQHAVTNFRGLRMAWRSSGSTWQRSCPTSSSTRRARPTHGSTRTGSSIHGRGRKALDEEQAGREDRGHPEANDAPRFAQRPERRRARLRQLQYVVALKETSERRSTSWSARTRERSVTSGIPTAASPREGTSAYRRQVRSQETKSHYESVMAVDHARQRSRRTS